MTKIKDIVDTILLLEAFSSPYKTTQGPEDFLGDAIVSAAKFIDASDPKIHNLPNNEKILSMHRNGAMELHHYPEDLSKLGSIIQGVESPNMRLISTALNIGEPHLATGGTISIPSSSDMHHRFLPLAQKIGARRGWEVESHPVSQEEKEALDPMDQLPSMHKIHIRVKHGKN